MGADGHLVMFDESTFIEFVICMVLHSFMKRTIDGAIGDYYGDIDGDKIMIYRDDDDSLVLEESIDGLGTFILDFETLIKRECTRDISDYGWNQIDENDNFILNDLMSKKTCYYYDNIEYRPDQIFDIITDTVSPSDSNMIFSDFYMHIKSDICMKVFPNIDVFILAFTENMCKIKYTSDQIWT